MGGLECVPRRVTLRVMQIVSIRELHHATGRIVRAAAQEPAVVTDKGRPVAIIQAVSARDLGSRPLPRDHWESRKRPILAADSTDLVSSDRDR